MEKTQLQQGDVWIESAELPDGAMLRPGNVLVEGEHTGHAHRITEGTFVILTHFGRAFLQAHTRCVLAHEEHAPVVIEPGTYAFGQILEYDYETEEARHVQD